MNTPLCVVFVCTGNAGRSQMAAALCEVETGDSLRVRSAGVEPWKNLHPMAVRLMNEQGISMEGKYPKPVHAILDKISDVIVTIGEPARLKLPKQLPGDPKVIHWDISDPADADGTPDSEPVFRRTKHKIEVQLAQLLPELQTMQAHGKAVSRPGIGTGMWYPHRFDPAIHLPQAMQAGFVAIELNCFLGEKHFGFRNPQEIRDLSRIACDLGLTLHSVHEPNNAATPGDIDPRSRQSAIDDMRYSMDLAQRIGAKVVVSHALLRGQYAKRETAELVIAVDSLLSLQQQIRDTGVRLALENGYPHTQPVLDAMAALPAAEFGFVLDTGHANISGGNECIHHIIRTMGHRLISLHLNDNNGKQDSHHPPGAPDCAVDWPALARELAGVNYQSCYMWEVFSQLSGRTDTPDAMLHQTLSASRNLFAHQPQVQASQW